MVNINSLNMLFLLI